MKPNNTLKFVLGISFIIILYLVLSYIFRQNFVFIQDTLSKGYFIGIPAYIFIMILDVVIVPIGIPFIPVATDIYGIFIASLLTILGWGLGCSISFFIARKYGLKVIKRFFSEGSIEKMINLIPEKNIFLFIIFIRIFLPLDIGSYSLGTFSKVGYKKYLFASVIGIIPASIILSYIGKLPLSYEAIALILLTIFVVVIFFLYSRKKSKKTMGAC